MPLVPLASCGRRGVLSHMSDTMDEPAGDAHIILFDEQNLASKARLKRHLVDLLDEQLARIISWMGFSGKDDLHGPRRVVENRLEPLGIFEQQRGALVGGKAPREANRKGVGVERVICRNRRHAEARIALAQPVAGVGDQIGLELFARFPQYLVGNLVNFLPALDIVDLVFPATPEVGIIQALHRGCQPCQRVNAVGNRRDRHIAGGVHPFPHVARNFAVQLADAIMLLRILECKHSHGESRPPVLLLECNIDELIAADAEFGPILPKILSRSAAVGRRRCQQAPVCGW